MKAILLILSFFTSAAFAETFNFIPDRTVVVNGAIGGASLALADKIVALSEKTEEPIQLFINSPGGEVIMGMQIIGAIDLARARGVTVQCFVSTVAASMGFHILAACSERYALRTSLFLWHPASVFLFGQVNTQEAKRILTQLKALESALNPRLLKELNISKRVFERYNKMETFHPGTSLMRISPKFLTLVDDVKNAPTPFFNMPRREQ